MNNLAKHYDVILKSVQSKIGLGCSITKVRKQVGYNYCDHNCDKCNQENVEWLNQEVDEEEKHLLTKSEHELLKKVCFDYKWLIYKAEYKVFICAYAKPQIINENGIERWKTTGEYAWFQCNDSMFSFVRQNASTAWNIEELIESYEKQK